MIQPKKVEKEIEFSYNFLEESKIKRANYEASSGSINYFLIKFLFEFLTDDNFTDLWNSNEKFTLVNDEIEKFSHPEMIYKIANMIVKLSSKIDIIVTTHSPIFLERILYINKRLYENGDKSKFKYSLKFLQNEDPFVLDSNTLHNNVFKKLNFRDLKNISNILFSTKIFLVEGLNDDNFIESIIQEDEELNHLYYTIIDCGGKGNVKKYYDITKAMNIIEKINLCLVYDKDNEDPIFVKDEFKNNTTSIIFNPDIESEFFKICEKNLNNNLGNEKFEKYIETKKYCQLKNDAKNLDMSYRWINENSTREDVKTKLEYYKKQIKKSK